MHNEQQKIGTPKPSLDLDLPLRWFASIYIYSSMRYTRYYFTPIKAPPTPPARFSTATMNNFITSAHVTKRQAVSKISSRPTGDGLSISAHVANQAIIS